MPTAYTIGNVHSYDEAVANEEPVHKLGARPTNDPPYEGGWVWCLSEEASAFIMACGEGLGFIAAVYAIELPTSWEEDVFPTVGEDGVHHLRHDALIVCKV